MDATKHLLSTPANAARLRESTKQLSAKRTVVLVVAIAALSGCATTRYVTVPCLTKDQVLPAEPERVKPRLTGKADEDLRIVAGSNLRLRAWGVGLQDILNGCRAK